MFPNLLRKFKYDAASVINPVLIPFIASHFMNTSANISLKVTKTLEKAIQ